MAYELKMSVEEVMQMPVSEIHGWRQFFEIRAREMKKATRRHG